VAETNDGFYAVVNNEARLRALDILHLPLVYENPQSMRILDIIARSREKGCWSYSMCSALKIDAKQLFHQSNVLVEFKVIQRLSNVPIPRHLKAHTNATHSSFFILSKFSRANNDPDISDVMDPAHSTDHVRSLILTLLREAGGVMIAPSLRIAVVSQGGFTSKQFRKGREKLIANRKVEMFLIPKTDAMEDEDEEDLESDEKIDLSKYVHAIRILDASDVPEEIKQEEELGTPAESEPEETVSGSIKSYLIANLLRSRFSFREAIMLIIGSGGSAGVTTKDITTLTGIGGKEVLKAMELIRLSDQVETTWRNEGKKKFIVYKLRAPRPSIKTDEDEEPLIRPGGKTPRSSKGYVTDQTVRRSSIALEIVTSRLALSLIDLGRAIEAHEAAIGIGIPGAQIDRRTLKKICQLAKIPLVEKGESASSKLIIAYDASQLSPEEAMRRVDRPVGITPKSTTPTEKSIKPSLLTPSSISSAVETPTTRRMNISELVSRGRLAALAVFGKVTKTSAPTFQKAQMYGLIRGGGDMHRSKLLHQYLLTVFHPGSAVGLAAMVESMPLVLFLQAIGCGSEHAFIDKFISCTDADLEVKIRDLPSEVLSHLRRSVPSSLASTSPEKQLSKALVLLVRIGLVRVERSGNQIIYLIQSEGGGVMGDLTMNRVTFDSPEAVEEFWKSLYRACMQWRESRGAGVYPPGLPHQLFKIPQWKCRIQVTLAQRRDLEAALRNFIQRADVEGYLIIDGSNEEIVRLAAHTKLDIGSILKALGRLHKLLFPQTSEKLLFASVHQARFSCPHCGQIFFQITSMNRHFETIHPRLPIPTNVQEFTRPEYLSAISKLRSLPKQVDSGQRRRRRRRDRRRTVEKQDTGISVSENRELAKIMRLACDLLDVPLRAPSEFDSSHLVWSVASELLGTSVELARIRLSGVTVESRIRTIKAEPVSPAAETLARLSVVQKLLDTDSVVFESLCRANGVDSQSIDQILLKWHSEGFLVIEKKNVRIQQISYSLSRQARVDMFGKFGDVDRLIHVIEHRNMVKEGSFGEELESVENACLIDRILLAELECEFEELTVDTSGDQEDEDEDDFKGIRRHLELAGSVSLDRVSIFNNPCSNEENPVGIFLQQVGKMHASSLSYVWRPTERQIGMDVEQSSSPETSQRIWNTAKEFNYHEWPVLVNRPKKRENNAFLDALFNVSPMMYFGFAPEAPHETVPLASWSSIDGDVRAHMLADMLLHVLCLVHTNPGISIDIIREKMRLVPAREIELLVSVWQHAGIMSIDAGELLVKPLHQW
jgi:hypothetical protein